MTESRADMPPPLPAPQCIKVTHRWVLNGVDGSNSFHVHYTGVWNAGDVNNLLAAYFAPRWDADLLGHFGAAFQGVEWEAIDLSNPLTPTVVLPHPTIGGGPDPNLPNINTLDVYWPVVSRVRGGRSHTFLTGWQTSGLDAGDKKLWSATQQAGALTWAQDIRGDVNGNVGPSLGNTTLGVVHYHRSHAVLTPPEFEAFLAPVADRRVHSRSRRLPR